MFGLKPKVVQIRLLTMLVGIDAKRGPWSADRGQVLEWDEKDARRLVQSGDAKIVDANAPAESPASA